MHTVPFSKLTLQGCTALALAVGAAKYSEWGPERLISRFVLTVRKLE